jgi:Cft2 family RNA processing exonuclease
MQSDRLPQLNNDDQSNTDQSDDVTNSNNVLLRAKIENYHKDTLNWESTGNKDNPRNWPFWKRVFHTAMPALMSFAV